MEIVLLGSILLLRVAESVTEKNCSKLMPTATTSVLGYIGLRMAISALGAAVLLIVSGDVISGFSTLSPLGWIISAATGIVLTLWVICNLMALKGASVAMGTLFSAAGMLVPTIAGIFLFDQGVGLGQWIGIFGLFVAAALLGSASGKTNGKLTIMTLLLLLGSMLFNGFTMLLQTLFQTYVPEGSVSAYSFLQFAIPAVILYAVSTVLSTKEGTKLPKIKGKFLWFTIGAAVTVLFISAISTIASGLIPVAVLFPISDGGGTVISAIVAALLFKERITWKSGSGIAVGVAALIAIKLFAP